MRRRQRRPAVTFSPELVAEIARMAPDHLQHEIAYALAISPASVSKWSRLHGIPTRSRSEAARINPFNRWGA